MLSINTIARVTVNTVRSVSVPAVFDTGLLLVKDPNFATDRRLLACDSGEAAAETLAGLGFSTTSAPYRAAQLYFGASPAPSRLLLSCYPSSETEVQALSAVLDAAPDFYGVFFTDTGITKERYLALAAEVEACAKPMALFLPLTGSPASVTDASGLLKAVCDAGYRRVFPFFAGSTAAKGTDTAAVLGTAMGLELSHRSSAFALCYKPVAGITPQDLTQSQADAVRELNGNVYLTRGGDHRLLETGSMASGLRYDELLYLDKIADDLQKAAVALLADNPDKLPQTDDATAAFINRFSAILAGYTNQGVLASAAWRGAPVGPVAAGEIIENGFLLWAGSYDDQSDADRAAHKAVPIQAALTLAGSIESIVMTVNVQI